MKYVRLVKKCPCCKIRKKRSEFYITNPKKDGVILLRKDGTPKERISWLCKKCYSSRLNRKEPSEKEKEYRKKWNELNKDKRNSYTHKRRAKRKNAFGFFTAAQLKARFDYYGNKCIYCGSTDKLTLEHRIPLSRGGTNWPSNIVPACKSCNCSKLTKTEKEFLAWRKKRTS